MLDFAFLYNKIAKTCDFVLENRELFVIIYQYYCAQLKEEENGVI